MSEKIIATAERLKKSREMQLEEVLLSIEIFTQSLGKITDINERAELELRIKNAEKTVIPELERDIEEFTQIIKG